MTDSRIEWVIETKTSRDLVLLSSSNLRRCLPEIVAMEIINLHWDPNPYSRGLLEEVVNLDNIPGEGFQLVGREVAVSKAETIDVAANKTKSTPHEVKKEAQAQAVDICKK